MTTASEEWIDGIGGLRISDDAGREAAGTLHSKANQKQTILSTAAANGIRIVDWFDETNVSGGTPLELRPYGQAIGRIENDEAQAIVFAYRSRHDRDIVEGAKAIQRMDRAAGVLLVGGTILTHRTPTKWAEATMGSFMSEWQKRDIAWSSAKGVSDAVADGRVPYPSVTLGLELCTELGWCWREDCAGTHNHVRPVANEAILAVVREAFAMRAGEETIDAVRRYLAANGYARSYKAIRQMLASPLYIGEIRYGGTVRKDHTVTPEYVKTGLFDPIVNPKVWERVQRTRVTRGRRPKSPRLLARQGVLICGSCGGRMIAMTRVANKVDYAYYRCGRQHADDCPQPVSVNAEIVEDLVLDAVERELGDIEERESAYQQARDADAAADQAAAALDVAEIRYLELARPGKAATAKLDQLRATAERLRAEAKQLRDELEDVEVLEGSALLRSTDPAELNLRRALIRRIMEGRVSVAPGQRGGRLADRRAAIAGRVTIAPRGETRRAAAA